MTGTVSQAAGVLTSGARELLVALALNSFYAAVLYGGVRLLLSFRIALGPLAARLSGRAGGFGAALRRWADRELPPVVELALWTAVVVRLVLPPGLAAPWSLRSLVRTVGSLVGLGGRGVDAGLPFDPSILLGSLGSASGEAAAGASAGSGVAGPWMLALAGVWALGAAVCLARFGRARRRFRRRIAAGRVLDRSERANGSRERRLLDAVARWRRVLGIRRPVTLVVGKERGPAAAPPCTLGVIRPVIWLPASLVDPEDTEDEHLAEAALAHELVHVRGRDDLWLRLLAVVRALYFFHPVAWWVSARIADARERAVDDAVLGRAIVTPRTYGRALLSILAGSDPGEASTHPADRTLFPAFGTPQRSTSMRIHRIVRRHAEPGFRTPRRLATLTALVVVALVAVVALPMAAAPASSANAASGHAEAHAHPAHASQDDWASPVHHARVTSTFGDRRDPFRAGNVSKHHDGVDLGAPSGTPVLAPADGVVTVATEQYRPAPDWGTVIIVDHGDGLQTRYAHLGSLAVTEGQKVSTGDTLGTVGATGRVTGPHLHFEVLRDGHPVDPATLVADLTD